MNVANFVSMPQITAGFKVYVQFGSFRRDGRNIIFVMKQGFKKPI